MYEGDLGLGSAGSVPTRVSVSGSRGHELWVKFADSINISRLESMFFFVRIFCIQWVNKTENNSSLLTCNKCIWKSCLILCLKSSENLDYGDNFDYLQLSSLYLSRDNTGGVLHHVIKHKTVMCNGGDVNIFVFGMWCEAYLDVHVPIIPNVSLKNNQITHHLSGEKGHVL